MASKEFHFHYVKTPTGAISGQSVLTQTEDAINDLGDYMFEATGDATEALNKATEALNTANTAQQNAAEALSTANSALGSVNTLTITVNSWDERIKKAESNAANAVTAATEASNNASQAVTTANSALNTAQQAVTTANAAKTTAQNASAAATQAVGTADAANATAEEAKKIAQQAVTDTDGIRDEINQSMVLITQKVNEATTQAQNSASSAAQSQANSDLSKRWATWTTGVETEDGTDYTVADDGYSSKWNAQLAQAWAVKTDGKVTENNLPDGAEIDYSSKYYAQQAKASADAADASEASALSSKNAAASSAAAAKISETNSKASETAAKSSQDAAAFSASAAKTSETNALASKNAAATSASAAKTSETNAKTSETNAKTSETAAASSKSAAASSASAAKTSETNAASSKAAAASSASAASTSATNASNSQKAAASSATSAANAQKAAEVARDLAQQYASQNAHAVVYDAQTLTTTQQAQARKNIGAISSADVAAGLAQKVDTTTYNAGLAQKVDTTTYNAGLAQKVDKSNFSNYFYLNGVPNTASAHNSIARGEDLKQWFTIDTLSAQVRAGNFSNIFIGDYLDVEMTSSISGTEMVRWQVAGIDSFLNFGYPDESMTSQHHLVLLPRDTFNSNPKFNSTDTTSGGFIGSAMWKTVLPAYATAVKNAFGSSHVLKHREMISNAMNASTPSMAGAGWNGATTGWDWYDVELMLPSEVQVYGTMIFSSSFYDVGTRNRQLPLFALCQDQLNAYRGYTKQFRSHWWLSAVASSAAFAFVGHDGLANCDDASVELCGIRPYFLFS